MISEFAAAVEAARAALVADDGRLWGVSMADVPWLAFDGDRIWLTDDPRVEGYVVSDGLWTGPRPTGTEASNTAVEWAGRRWASWTLPLPKDAVRSLVHEAFHVIQPRLMSPGETVSGSDAFDTVEGRVSLRLELEALARALDGDRDAPAQAVAFRDRRVETRDQELAQELWEGMAEYTGWRLAGASAADVAAHVRAPAPASWRRHFAYRTGPAYGFLLDQHTPDWRPRIKTTDSLHLLLEIDGSDSTTTYDIDRIRAEEQRAQAEIDAVTGRFATDALVRIRPQQMQIVFDPGRVYPGSIYGGLRWSSNDSASLDATYAQVSFPDQEIRVPLGDATVETGTTYGDGWTLTVPPHWSIRRGGAGFIVAAIDDPRRAL